MNLHKLVSSRIAHVNKMLDATVKYSTGYTTVNYKQVPSYSAPTPIQVQAQPLTANEIALLDGLNIQGENKALFANGSLSGVKRADGTGGDLVTLPDGSIWLVVLALEDWTATSGWSKVAVTRQLS